MHAHYHRWRKNVKQFIEIGTEEKIYIDPRSNLQQYCLSHTNV